MNGWTGTLLRVDLTRGVITREALDMKAAHDFVGARGLGTKYFCDEVDPKVDPLGPDNKLIFMTGPLTGTSATCGGRYEVVAKAPLTGTIGASNSGGHFGPELKYAGYDGVIAFGIIMYVSYIFVGCYLGFSVGTAPIIGYNYGAKNTDELNNVFRKSLLFIMCAAAIMTAASIALANPLAAIFVSADPELLDMSANALRIFSASFIISGFNIYGSAFFTALNNGIVSAIISLARTLVFQVLAVFVTPLVFGINGLWSATVFAELLTFAVTVFFVAKNRNKYGYSLKQLKINN